MAVDASQTGSTRGVLGILGGTFDPIHDGHLELAREVRQGCDLECVLLIPAGRPPHRDPPVASAADRLAMVRLAVDGHPGLAVDAREIARAGPSYTALTLDELRAQFPDRPIALLIGADALQGLPAWHRFPELLDLAHLIVVGRPGIDPANAIPPTLATEWRRRHTVDPAALRDAPAGIILTRSITPHPVSGSAIRALLAARDVDAVRRLLPPTVLAYIERHRLYQPQPDAP